jgi:hypothetical protein
MCEKRPSYLRFLLCGLILVKTAAAQELINDSITSSLYNSFPVSLYYNAIGENAHIYTGYEYFTPDRNIKGSPYFLSDGPVPSRLIYDDSYYQDIPVLFDIARDELVVNRLGQNFKISLVNDKLMSFTVRNHEFIRISRDSAHGIELESGFYDKMYAGKTIVLVKRKRKLQETLVYNSAVYEYKDDYKYYVISAGLIVQVDSKSSVLELFKSKKAEIKSFLRKNKLNFKSDFEKALVATSAYYDQLTS